MEQKKFIKGKTYYCFYLKEVLPSFVGHTFEVSYKNGSTIIIQDPYHPEVKIKCTLESHPAMEIINISTSKLIWRDFCQEKLENGKFEQLPKVPDDLPKPEDF